MFKNYTPKQLIGLLVISSLLLMENIDANILNVAIPQMAHSFASTVFTMKLAVTSYLIGLSVFIPISGWMSDRFGSKKILMLSIVLFTLMSIQCGLTDSVPLLVICRLLQGVAGAFMVPVGRLLLLKIFDKSQMVKAYTLMGMPVLLGPILAPILGGFLVTFFSWRYIFWVNVPLGVMALYATIKHIDNYTEEQDKFNFYSYVFLALALCCFCFWLDLLLSREISYFTKGMLFSGAVFFGLIYYLIESKSTFPVIRYHLFRLRTFSSCFFSQVIIRASLGGRTFILAVFLEITFRKSAFAAGFVFIWMSLGVLCSRTVTRKLLEKFGFKRALLVANVGSFIALSMLAMVNQLGWFLYLALFFNGVFAAMQFMSLNLLYYADVENIDYGSAVSLATTWQQLGTSLGVIVAAGLLHIANYVSATNFAISSFHYVFFALAFINLSCQFLLNRLEKTDGQTLISQKYKHEIKI